MRKKRNKAKSKKGTWMTNEKTFTRTHDINY